MYKKILIPIDPYDLEVGVAGFNDAKSLLTKDGEITILSVFEPLPTPVFDVLPENFQHEAMLEVKGSIEALLKKHNVKAKILLRIGRASGTIITAQLSEEYDLIIIASHKPHNKDYLLGTTASSVVRKAECPVLVVR